MRRFRVPTLPHPGIVVRLAENQTEIDNANRLIFTNYVAAGFWDNDEKQLRVNKFLHHPARHTFVMLDDQHVVGTLSIIVDTPAGLPSDNAQPAAMQRLRSKAGALAEVSAFAMDQSRVANSKFMFFLISYMFQYSFYYAGIDRLVASCGSRHADFYESVLCFSKISDPTYYAYTRDIGRLLSLDLLEAHPMLCKKYPADAATGKSFYRFLLRDHHLCQQFPAAIHMKRSRQIEWEQEVSQKAA